MAIIIIEGENKCGKTTLAKKICEDYGYEYIKCSQPKGDPYIEYMQILKKIEKSGKDYVIDRFLYGEFVYGPIYRGTCGLTKEQKRNIELKAMTMNAYVIYCMDDAENIAKRFKKDKEEFADINKIEKTLDLFAKVIINADLPRFVHKMNSKNDLTKGKRLERFIEKVEKAEELKTEIKQSVGNCMRPMFVFVGEKRNEKLMKQYKKYKQPFDFGVSSEYLFEQIKTTGITLDNFLIINSDAKHIGRAVNKGVFVVALGKAAAKKLESLKKRHDFEYYVIGHPSYERRFRGTENRITKFLIERFRSL